MQYRYNESMFTTYEEYTRAFGDFLDGDEAPEPEFDEDAAYDRWRDEQ